MDLMYFLRARTKFVRYVYESVVPQFEEIKRKIQAGEEPYVDRRYVEDADEPAFLEEWENADLAGDVIGVTCLGMLQAAFHSFLEEYVKEVGGKELLNKVNDIFSNYIYQTEKHATKYPDTAFRDPQWPVSMFMPVRLIVEQKKLEAAIESIEQLCEYLEGTRPA
jgi:hypothetical protein